MFTLIAVDEDGRETVLQTDVQIPLGTLPDLTGYRHIKLVPNSDEARDFLFSCIEA